MKQMSFSGRTDLICAALCALFGVALQIQITLFHSPDYLGLRFNLADIFVPFAGLLIAITLCLKQSQWPQWSMRHVYLWLAALTAIFILALAHSYILFGELSRWALVNKFFGWFILLGLFGTGGWLAANASQPRLIQFVRIFFAAFLVILLYQLALRLAQAYALPLPVWAPLLQDQYWPINGSMANRNAYGFLLVTLTGFAGSFYFSRGGWIPLFWTRLLFFLLPAFVIFNASRAMCIALAVILVVLFAANYADRRKCLQLLGCVAAGCLMIGAMLWNKPLDVIFLRAHPVDFITKTASNIGTENASIDESVGFVQYPGDDIRLNILRDALDQIRVRPVFGSGLGGAMLYQAQRHGNAVNVIDSTPLWLWAETGAAGLACFVLFYLCAIRSLWPACKHGADFSSAFQRGLLLTIVAFSVMCLFHEIFYTRHLWFLLGMGLALPVARTHQDE